MLSPSIIEHVPHGRMPRPTPTAQDRWKAWREKVPETRGNNFFKFANPVNDPFDYNEMPTMDNYRGE